MVLASNAGSLLNFRGPLLAALSGSGVRVTAVAPHMSETIRDGLRALGAEPLEVKMQRAGMNPLADIAYFFRLRDLIKRVCPDVLIAYTAKPVIWSALAAPRGKRRVATISMITGLGYAFTPPERISIRHRVAAIAASALYWIAMRRTSHVVFQNPDDLALFRRRHLVPSGVPTSIMPGSGVDLTHFAPVDLPSAPAFLMIARLLGAKGTREYAAACIQLKERYPSISFRLVGGLDDGPDAISGSELESWIAAGLEYGGSVIDVRPEIAQASCIVLPSYREGTPRVVLEAMAMGRAIITSDAPGCRQTTIHCENGLLVPPRDTAAVAEAIERLILNPDDVRRFGFASLVRAREIYDVHLANAVLLRAVGVANPDGGLTSISPSPSEAGISAQNASFT